MSEKKGLGFGEDGEVVDVKVFVLIFLFAALWMGVTEGWDGADERIGKYVD